MKLVISVDVEEEGLFTGRYPRHPPGVANVSQLSRLEFIPREFGFPLTLMVTYHAALDPGARRVLERWRDLFGAEIGAHLHPWNTPPFENPPAPFPHLAHLIPPLRLERKLHTLLAGLQEALGVTPQSFRMGRFHLTPELPAFLGRAGVRVDSSMVPLRREPGGPDHFLAPADPFYLPAGPREPGLLEVPLTVVPVWSCLPPVVYRLSQSLPRGGLLRSWFRYVGALGPQPSWFPLASMIWAVRLHRRRGGRVITMFLHSSELQPGATPAFFTEKAVARLVDKIRRFLIWLIRSGPVQGVQMSQLLGESHGP